MCAVSNEHTIEIFLALPTSKNFHLSGHIDGRNYLATFCLFLALLIGLHHTLLYWQCRGIGMMHICLGQKFYFAGRVFGRLESNVVMQMRGKDRCIINEHVRGVQTGGHDLAAKKKQG